MPDRQTPGEIAYLGYYSHRSGKTWDGNPMPRWDALPPDVQAAWQAAARTVRRAVASELTAAIEDGHRAHQAGRP